MRYIGGKSKIARALSQAILAEVDTRVNYYEPFVGGGSVLAHMAPHFRRTVASDLSEDLILMWQALREGWEPPPGVSEQEYADLKEAAPSALRGLVGFGGSFGGKWFGGYARGGQQANGAPRNHQGESARAVLRIRDLIAESRVDFVCGSYDRATPPAGTVVYCDPPYAATQGYDAVGAFDSARFWEVVNVWREAGAHVFVSEYWAPSEWRIVWERTHRQSLVLPKQGRHLTTERLFYRAPTGVSRA